jgi:hypothetical protein
VLSALLRPFFPVDTGHRVDEDRWIAIECFEIVTKTWTVWEEEVSFALHIHTTGINPPTVVSSRALHLVL